MVKNTLTGLLVLLVIALLIGLFFVLPVALMGWGAYRAWDQDRQIVSAQPVEAEVLASEVVTKTSGRGSRSRTKYLPIVRYRYSVDGQTYEGSRATPLDDIDTSSAANAVVQAYPAGATGQAYYLPADPSRSFLFKHYSTGPYEWFYVGLGLAALFLSCGMGYAFYREAPPAASLEGAQAGAGESWTCLGVSRTLRARFVVNLAQGMFLLGMVALATWHYFTRIPGPHAFFSRAVPAAFALWGLCFIGLALKALLTRRAVSDAVVFLSEPLAPGRSVRARVRQDLGAAGDVDELKIGLVCRKTTGSGKHSRTTTQWESWHSERSPKATDSAGGSSLAARVARLTRASGAARHLAVEKTLTIPSDQPPSTPSGKSADPSYEWKLAVVTVLPACPDYREEFRVTVQPAEVESGK